MTLRLTEAIPMLATVLDHFDKLSAWEKDFVSGLTRIASSGKMRELSDSQEDSLSGLYCRVILAPKLPDTHRTLAQEKARKEIEETTPMVIRATFHEGRGQLDPVRYMGKSKVWVDEIEKAAVAPARRVFATVRALRTQLQLKGTSAVVEAIPAPAKET